MDYRFRVSELSPKTVRFLQSLGHEAIRANQLGMGKSENEGIIEYAARNDMIVITADLDFGDILAYAKHKNPAVGFQFSEIKPYTTRDVGRRPLNKP